MADKVTNRVAATKGSFAIDEWIRRCVISHPAHEMGTLISNVHFLDGSVKTKPINGVGILMENCQFMRIGTDQNHGLGGSNCVTGNPVCFVDIVSVLPRVFASGIFGRYTQPCFILPLCMVGEIKPQDGELMTLMCDAYVNFIALKHGDNLHDVTHIANGIACGLSAICFALCKEISLNGNIPNAVRMVFLVEALCVLGFTARSVARKDAECNKIFKLLPMLAQSADVFQSVLLGFLFNILPSEEIRVNLVAASIRRHFRAEYEKSYITKPPVGLIGVLLIAPMLGQLLATDFENVSVINQIVQAVNQAIQSITQKIMNDATLDMHKQNQIVLEGFANANKHPFVSAAVVTRIYTEVCINRNVEKNMAKIIGCVIKTQFVDTCVTSLRIKNQPVTNFAIICDHKTSNQNTVCYIPSITGDWTGVRLKPGGHYLIQGIPIGIAKFQTGETAGKQNIANFRFTVGHELLSKDYDGYASTGITYHAKTRKYQRNDNQSIADPNVVFELITDCLGVKVTQKSMPDLLMIPESIRQQTDWPLVSFKNCQIVIECVKEIPMTKDNEEMPQAPGGPQQQQTIMPCNLRDQFTTLASVCNTNNDSWGR